MLLRAKRCRAGLAARRPRRLPTRPAGPRTASQGEGAADAGQFMVGQVGARGVDLGPLFFHLTAELLGAQRGDQDLDAGLVDVVAAAVAVVDAQDGFQIAEQTADRQELLDGRTDIGRAPLAAADDHLEAQRAVARPAQHQADVVHLGRRAVLNRAGDGDLELARQIAELGVQGRPLADHLGPHARIVDLVGDGAGIGVGRGVADAVAAGLDGVQVDLGQGVQDVRRVLQLHPVELDVLTRGHVAVALVVGPGDPGQATRLGGVQRAIRDGHPQHVGVQLQIEAVHQPQRLELVLGQLAGQAALHLAPELVGAVGQELTVDDVVLVHRYFLRIRSTRPVERAAPAAWRRRRWRRRPRPACRAWVRWWGRGPGCVRDS
jgi:hypothetical protein